MAADSRVQLIVDAAKAVNPLRAVRAAGTKAEQAINQLKKAVDRTGSAFQRIKGSATSALGRIARSAKDAAAKFGGFGKAALVAAGAAAAIGGIRFAFAQAGELERQTKSLEVLTGSAEKAKSIVSELQAFGAVTPFTSTELIETSKRLKAFGFETEQVVGVTKRLADVAGATGADLDGIATAFGQIRAKGRLMGEENLQLLERGVDLQGELQKMYGMTGEEFSKAMESGRISADAVNVALERLTSTGGQYANGAIAQSDTLFGKLSTLQDAIMRFGQNIGMVLAPVFKFLITQVTNLVNLVNNAFANVGARREAIEAARERGIKGTALRKFMRTPEFRESVEGFKSARISEQVDAPSTVLPELRAGRGGGGAGGKSEAERQAEKAEQLRQRELDTDDQIRKAQEQKEAAANREFMLLTKKLALQEATTEAARREIENAHLFVELVNKHGEIEGERLYQMELQLQLGELRKTQEQELADQQEEAAKRIADRYRQIGNTIKTGVVDAIGAAVFQTKTLAEVASNTLNNLANQLLNMGVNMLLGSLGGGNPASIFTKLFGDGLAEGGRAQAGRSYIVGERGPELFTPGGTGTVTPNHALMGGGSIVVNVDASGSAVEGEGAQAKQLGNVIGVAVRQELLKQKRPGGLLA